MSRPYIIDPACKPYLTERQAEYVDAVNEHGSYRAADRALGLANDMVRKNLASAVPRAMEALRRAALEPLTTPGFVQSRVSKQYNAEGELKSTAVQERIAPIQDPDEDPSRDGLAPWVIKGKSTLYDANGDVRQQWVKTRLDADQMQAAIREAAEAMAADIPRLPPISPPERVKDNLANVYTFTDCHVGMLAWRLEGGADWDLRIAERTLVKCFEAMIYQSPAAAVAVINQLGDFLHSDGLLPVTPTSGHVLDQDGRFSKMVGVALRVLRRIVDIALMRHEHVVLVLAEGNHDLAGAVWLRHMFLALYENEPRLEVINSELPYYAYQHGDVMLGFHHGHLRKPEEFPGVFAAQFPKIWGSTTHRYAHAGHRHNKHVKEHNGMTVTQHPTLAARDAYASRGGWFAERGASAITYHAKYGQVAETTVTPEMLD